MEASPVAEQIKAHEAHEYAHIHSPPETVVNHAEHGNLEHVCTAECQHDQAEADRLASELFADIKTPTHGETGHVCTAECKHTQAEADTLAESLFAPLEDKPIAHSHDKSETHHGHEHGHQIHVCTADCKHSQQEADIVASELFEKADDSTAHGETGHVCTAECKHTQAEADTLAEELFASVSKEAEKHATQEVIDKLPTRDEQAITVPNAADERQHLEQAVRLQGELAHQLSKQTVEARSSVHDIGAEEVPTTETDMQPEQEPISTFEVEAVTIADTNEVLTYDIELPQPTGNHSESVTVAIDAPDLLFTTAITDEIAAMESLAPEVLQMHEGADELMYEGKLEPADTPEPFVKSEWMEVPDHEAVLAEVYKSVAELVPELEADPEVTEAIAKAIVSADEQTVKDLNDLFQSLQLEAKPSTTMTAHERKNDEILVSVLEGLSERLGIESALLMRLLGIRPAAVTLTPESWEIVNGLQKLLHEEHRKEFDGYTKASSDDTDLRKSLTKKLGQIIIHLMSRDKVLNLTTA